MNTALTTTLGLAAMIALGSALATPADRIGGIFDAPASTPAAAPTLTRPVLVGDGPLVRIELRVGGATTGGGLMNIGFLEPGQPARWLFPGQGGPLIVAAEPLSLRGDLLAPIRPGQDIFAPGTLSPDALPPSRDRDTPHEVALMLVLVSTDSNADGRLTPEDGLTLALTRPDGSGRTELATGLTAAPQVLPSTADLAFLIPTAGGFETLRLNPATFDITDRQPVTLP
ncbi:hypothetical protein ACEYYB_04300 [Paracoccus sp. p4-l81]|uniref:hypothetical protein n=1 Tax=Paracoccus sp. p4-l81 TaxID=3342806 RepID=UPI0035B752A2